MSKHQLLRDIAIEIESDNLLKELRESASQLVMGAGSFDTDIVFIGEAPGRKEDESGLPFMGLSGRLLDEGLELAGLRRRDVYITNIVKYRPPGNRDPSNSEKDYFWPYLVKEIEVIKPKVIATLGRHSLSFIIPSAKINQDHGKRLITEIDGVEHVVVPLYHPAATIYNRSLKPSFNDDFIKLREIVEQIN